MGFVGEVWQVRKGEESVGEILIDDADFPWLSGKFTAGEAFEAVRELFARELALAQGTPTGSSGKRSTTRSAAR